MSGMCPYCGAIVAIAGGLTVVHSVEGDPVCQGSQQHARNPESDGRPLWSGKPNPHFGRRGADQ